MRACVRDMLIAHCRAYPALSCRDLFKYIYQSAFGAEHLVTDYDSVLARITEEHRGMKQPCALTVEPLARQYSRVHLSAIDKGLSPKTLARLFCLTADIRGEGVQALSDMLSSARELAVAGEIPLDPEELDREAAAWQSAGYPAVRHSEGFHIEYSPAYRVIADRYANNIGLFTVIDKYLSERSSTVLCIEGGAGSGKSTLAEILREVYGCSVIHMDDFFLRPEQRTKQRLAEVGGNIDRERFSDEVVKPLSANKTVQYRCYDCNTQSLADTVTVEKTPLTVIEGVYSMHETFGEYYDLSVFIDIDSDYQRERILARNSPAMAQRFFDEWIPKENAYFDGMMIKERAKRRIKISR